MPPTQHAHVHPCTPMRQHLDPGIRPGDGAAATPLHICTSIADEALCLLTRHARDTSPGHTEKQEHSYAACMPRKSNPQHVCIVTPVRPLTLILAGKFVSGFASKSARG